MEGKVLKMLDEKAKEKGGDLSTIVDSMGDLMSNLSTYLTAHAAENKESPSYQNLLKLRKEFTILINKFEDAVIENGNETEGSAFGGGRR